MILRDGQIEERRKITFVKVRGWGAGGSRSFHNVLISSGHHEVGRRDILVGNEGRSSCPGDDSCCADTFLLMLTSDDSIRSVRFELTHCHRFCQCALVNWGKTVQTVIE